MTDAACEILKKVRRHRASSLKGSDRWDIRLPHEGTNRICISGFTRYYYWVIKTARAVSVLRIAPTAPILSKVRLHSLPVSKRLTRLMNFCVGRRPANNQWRQCMTASRSYLVPMCWVGRQDSQRLPSSMQKCVQGISIPATAGWQGE